MTSSDVPRPALARRLRSLRVDGLPGHRVTQADLARALSGRKPVSVPSISSWETGSAVPPYDRLEAYATFFATERSVVAQPFRLLTEADLTEQERTRRDDLLQELIRLRDQVEDTTSGHSPWTSGAFWRFPRNHDITIVGAELPQSRRKNIPYADPTSLDYVEAYQYSDLDALILVHGHIRAFNPQNVVNVRTPSTIHADEYTTNLVLLGGVDWNALTRELLNWIKMPVRQLKRESDIEVGGFDTGDGSKLFEPKLREIEGKLTLVEDVAHFYRGPNPFNRESSITIFNGMFGRGTLGVVAALIDPQFLNRNEPFVLDYLSRKGELSIITKVGFVGGRVVTPDWTEPDTTLHVWPAESNG